MACEYCSELAYPFHMDHVLPRSLVSNYNRDRAIFPEKPAIPAGWLAQVPSCGSCNWRKLTLRLVPPSWAHLVEALSEFFGGTPFRVYEGGPVT